METDFRAFILLVETIIEIRQNSVFKKYYCYITDFRVETILFLRFSETRVSFSSV